MPRPAKIARDGSKGILIFWEDGSEHAIPSDRLRRLCPCAGCREARGDSSHSKPLTPGKHSLRIVDSSLAEQTRLEEIWGIGNYALGLRWADGHDTGIYTYQYLLEIATKG